MANVKVEVYNANVRVRELPRASDNAVTALAEKRGCNKWEIIREAIMEYVEAHKEEINA